MGFEPTNLRGGSWVRFPSGARIFSPVSYFQIKTFYLSDANYATDDHTDAFSSLHTTSSPAPTPPPTFKQFVGNGQKLVQTRDSWKIQKKGNNVLAGKRKRVLVRKTRLLATSLSILISVVTISFLFQIHLFILWQNSRIVASTLRCSSRIHFSTQSVQNCLLFPSFCEMKALEVKEDCGSFTTETEWINMYFKRLLRSDHNYTQPWKPLSFAMGCKMCARFYEDRCAIVLMKNTSILHLYSFDR